ncbi:MAG: hypothetical protein IKB82_05295 [Clostridia bacterium]|nr:hypothetical protein [Clostridia bacterium]
MDAITAVQTARNLLSELTPLKTDCGRLCEGACCQGDESTGMLLFPGEDALYEHCDFARITPADFELGGKQAQLFVCEGHCPRDARPLSCRLFPLFLAFLKSGKTKVRMDTRAAHICPLYEYGAVGLDEAFVDAARKAYDALLACPECEAYLRDLHKACSL